MVLTEERINKKLEEAYETTADEFNMTIEQGVKANKLRFIMRFLQAGATLPTLNEILTQFASYIEIAIGTTTLLKVTPTEFYEYLVRKKNENGIGFIYDGTGADNHVMILIFELPLCPLDKNEMNFMNKDYGFDGSKDVSVTVNYPADGNKVDGRVLDVYAVSEPDSNPTKIIEWEELTKTYTATGDKQDLGISQDPNNKMFEIVFKQTSYLSEGLTAFTRTIEKISYVEGKKAKLFFDKLLEHFNGIIKSDSFTTGAMRHDDQYVIVPFYHGNDAETSQQLVQNSALSVTVGVAEAVTYIQIRTLPLSAIQ